MSDVRHVAIFSHEFEQGPSGPPRSYWNIERRTGDTARGLEIGSVAMHHRDSGMDPARQADTICWMLDRAFEAGRAYQAARITETLNYKAPSR